MDDLGVRCLPLLAAEQRAIGLVTLRFVQKATEVENFAQNTDAVETLRAIVARAKARFPAVKIGLTGLPVMENDEMRLSQSAMTTVTFLSLGGVFLVLVAGFGGLRHSVLATVALVLGTIWTVGYTTVTVGLPEHPQHRLRLDPHGLGDQLRHLLRRPLPADVRPRRGPPPRRW